MGDRFIVDTKDNIGYLIHPNGSYAHFPVITGQNRVVNYIGRTYKATTPTREWVAGSSEVKGDRVTFGPSGRFLRLYYEDESTPYGIHEHRSEVVMFEREDRYQSMGCVIVKTFIMDLMVRTFAVNEGKIQVETIYGYSPEGTETLAANI